ncbi:MAG: ZIP family metal transporter [Nitrospinota bacterium]
MESSIANEAVLTVLLFSTLAAGLAALGTLPFSLRERVPLKWIGWAYALASGLMLGAGYIVMTEGLDRATLSVISGGGLGVAYTYWTQAYSGTTALATEPGDEFGAEYSVKFILQNAMHSASEGVAIGVAMVVNLKLGIFMALSLAVHNIAEAMVLTDVLRTRKMSIGECAGMCIVTNVPQILLAIVAFAVTPAIPGFLPWALGFAAGALVYLVMTELLPSSYERAGHTGIAFVVSFATGGVVLVKGLFV